MTLRQSKQEILTKLLREKNGLDGKKIERIKKRKRETKQSKRERKTNQNSSPWSRSHNKSIFSSAIVIDWKKNMTIFFIFFIFCYKSKKGSEVKNTGQIIQFIETKSTWCQFINKRFICNKICRSSKKP